MARPSDEAATPESVAYDLLAAEGMSDDPESAAAACSRVVDRLSDGLRPLVGRGGFEALLGRAAIVAGRRHPRLEGLSLRRGAGPDEADLCAAIGEDGAAGDGALALITELLGFMSYLFGWKLTLVLLRGAWPDIADRYDPDALEEAPSRDTPKPSA